MRTSVIVIFFLVGFALFSCDNTGKDKLPTDVVRNTKSATGDESGSLAPHMHFTETEHDFGKLIQGEKVSYSFHFTNTGGSDLLINKVSTSCGCTVTNYPRTPLRPGEKGTIEVTFDSRHKKGHQNKTVTIMANTEPSRTISRIRAKVVLPERN